MLRTGICFLTAVLFSGQIKAQLPEVSEEALAELGDTYGTPQMNGFVFIEGRYIPPPYTVTRKGNGIFINRIQVEQPVPWPAPGLKGAEPVESAARGERAPTKKSIDADGDFEEVRAKTNAVAEPPAANAATEPNKPQAIKSIDDLFADDTAKPADQAQPPAAQIPVATAPAATAAASVERMPEDVAREKEALIANLERTRKGYEQSLSRGDMFFFGQRHSRVNGNYGTARTMMTVLPSALRYAESPNDLWQRLAQGGVYFIDIGLCTELFRHKKTFPLLEERLRKIKEAEAFETQRRRPANVW